MKYRLVLLFSLCLFVSSVPAQKKSNTRFGKISPSDFKTKIYSIDSNANAVIIADIGSTEMNGNTKGGITLEFKRYRRAHVLNKNGYDIASVVIGLYTKGGDEEELVDLKAVTYNLENGKVIQTELNENSVYTGEINKNLIVKKFTLPAIREGCIIEYEYKLKSDFVFNLQPWDFQGEYPALWSEYSAEIPAFYNYAILSQGYQPYYINEKKQHTDNFIISDGRPTYDYNSSNRYVRGGFIASVTSYRWVMKDIPALKEENYTSTIKNHLSRVEFQLAAQGSPFEPHDYMGSWKKACEDLLQMEDFGQEISRDNNWLNDIVGEITGNAKNELDKAKSIFGYARDNMTCTASNGIFLQKNLRTVLRERSGNVAEINLLLIAMLRGAGLKADPVILSTKAHGYVYSEYPLIDRFNYVIARVIVQGETYLLDASQPDLGFDRLGYECYNGQARVVDATATPLELNADSLREAEITSVSIAGNDEGILAGEIKRFPGYFASNKIREQVEEKGIDLFFKELNSGLGDNIKLTDYKIDSLKNYDDPVAVDYKFNIEIGDGNIIYFNPLLTGRWQENPFKSAYRNYPVEMPYLIDQTYLAQIAVPNGYTVDELPKQTVVKLNDDNGMFEYRIAEVNGVISLRTRLSIKHSFFLPGDYKALREFFNLVVKKDAELIVFKKKTE